MTEVSDIDASRPDRAEVRAALDRLLASDELRGAARSREFLSYVVTETLAGRADRLSERTVGRGALGQGTRFDGSRNASVRVRASRVRKALELYYSGPGFDDPVRISIPPGSYVPLFQRSATTSPRARTVPGVAVVTLGAAGGSAAALAGSLTDALAHRLGQYSHLRIVGPTAMVGDVRATGSALEVSTVLDGRVVEREHGLKVSMRLSATDTGELLWSTDQVILVAELAGFQAEDVWAEQIAAQLGDTTGVVVRRELERPRPANGDEASTARLAFYSYVDQGTTDSLVHAGEQLDRALVAGHRTAALLAMRAAAANAAQAFGIADRPASLELAARLAREALTLDGGNAHAHLVLASVAHYGGDWDTAIQHAETAVALAPRHPTYLIGAAGTLCGSGEWDRGAELIREAQRLNPGLTGRTHTWLAAGHLVRGDHARALAEASWLPADGGFVWGPLFRAMALAGLGDTEQAGAELEAARAARTDVVEDPASFFAGQMRLTPEQLARLVDLVRAAAASAE